MKKLKLLFVFATLTISAPSLTSCNISKIDENANIDEYYKNGKIVIPEGQTVDIDWWTWGGKAAEEIFTNIANVYSERVNPQIKVHYTCYPSSGYLSTLANAANHLPDLFFMPDTDFYKYAFDQVIWNFRDYITDEELDDVWEAGYERYMYNPTTKLVGNADGAGLYALPKDISTFSLCYNEDMMKEACSRCGLVYEDIKSEYLNDKNPINWDKFKELGHKFDNYFNGSNKFFLSHYELNSALFSNNADFLSDDGLTSRVEEPQFAGALDFMKSLATEGLMAGASGSSTTTGYNSFVGKNAMFSFFGPWDCEVFWGVTSTDPHAMDFAVRMVPVPFGPGADGVFGTNDDGHSCCQIGSAGYCISRKTSTTNLQRAAALEFCKYLTINEEAQRELYQKGTQFPNLKSMRQEYVDFGQGTVTTYLGEQVPVNPKNLNAFIDVCDGYDGVSDKVDGRAKTETRILTNEFKQDWSNKVTAVDFWNKPEVTGADLVEAYKDTLQTRINESREALGK